jgi:hypothetical protein
MRPRNEPETHAQKLFTFSSGGWVLAIAGLLVIIIAVVGLGPVVMHLSHRLPGDGRTLASYEFDLDPCLVEQNAILIRHGRRNIIEPLNDPQRVPLADLHDALKDQRGKYLVPGDRVVGLTVGDETCAYPVAVLAGHGVINDTLGGTPIAILYSPESDAVVAVQRPDIGDSPAQFAPAGLMLNCNLLVYALADEVGGESLWSPLQARAITGEAAVQNHTLCVLPAQLCRWDVWQAQHPDTQVVVRDAAMIKRYEAFSPEPYFLRGEPIGPYAPAIPDPELTGVEEMDRVIAVTLGDAHRIYPLPLLLEMADINGLWTDTLNGVMLTFQVDAEGASAHLALDPAPPDMDVQIIHGFWFAVHAADPRRSADALLPRPAPITES